MENLIVILIIISFIVFTIGFTFASYSIFKYFKYFKEYNEAPEDKTGLYDYIEIDNHLINIDTIVYINYKYSIQEKISVLNIILNNKEKLFFKFDIIEEGIDVYEQIVAHLDPTIITID